MFSNGSYAAIKSATSQSASPSTSTETSTEETEAFESLARDDWTTEPQRDSTLSLHQRCENENGSPAT